MNMFIEEQGFVADILIVDDKLENIRFLSEFLSQNNYQVRKAINGQAALTSVNSLPPDLILLDINMPGMGGYEVCQHLKNDPATSAIPVIFLSAGNEVNDKILAFEAGGIDYITKPFNLEEILVRVKTQLKVQQLQKKLSDRNQEIQTMLLELQKTEAALIQKEKLVNASQITAGISHEINNPLSFIVGNLKPASEYSENLIKLIQLYQQAFPDATPEIKDFIESIELDFLIPDLRTIITSLHTGAERIRSVIIAMHIFSRLHESGIKEINIQESIESVLLILRYQLVLDNGEIKISVVRNYEATPKILGQGNLLNQALLNILQNAIQSLESKISSVIDSSFKPTIWINLSTTEQQQIRISIKDNGIGISPENQPRLFEPFFTTKSPGKGVGLGLFTSYQIITEFHKGTLTYHDCPEGGSEFIIEIS
ncbi:hybrid sensor histidine kinase/response regulator [Nodularia sp. NIES-3585]|uniref:hybrid sensor histidine kinase/response regulator n=1 Tax=Nodularia sp. NIES-3585 TaxID=1973477 RepID=UPI000B5CE2FD|nr:response regulator [Nodularia sp. NIES-3585]GAX37136.1 response regulator receiver sensor signal transduction histidine kinase [Nodularia sp. NIES-3585]